MSERESFAVTIDEGSSLYQYSSEVVRRGIRVLPLTLKFPGDAREYFGYEIFSNVFYRRMGESRRELPTTSGGAAGKAAEIFTEIGKETNKILAISLTLEHSSAYSVAVQGAKLAMADMPGLEIRNVNSRVLSIPELWLAEQAVEMSQNGASFDEIERVTLETIPKMEIEMALNTMENVVRGGRVSEAKGLLGSLLDIKLIINLRKGKLDLVTKSRGMKSAMRELVKRLKDGGGKIERLAVVHTNNTERANTLVDMICEGGFYPRENIPIYEAGSLLAVHAGEGALAIARQRK